MSRISGRALAGLILWVVFLNAVCSYAGTGAALARGLLAGTNTLSFSVLGFDPLKIDLSDSLLLSYRIDDLFVSSRTAFSLDGLTSQDFRLRTPLGDFTMQGSLSFSSTDFTRATLGLSGLWEGLTFITSFTLSKGGSPQTPSVAFASSTRASGSISNLGRLSLSLDVGTTTSDPIQSCSLSFKRMRVVWGGLSFCGGDAAATLIFGCRGLEAGAIHWSVPISFCAFNLRFGLRYIALFEFQGLSVSLTGQLGEVSVAASFSFDADYAFRRGSWSLNGPFLGGTLSSANAFDETELLTWDLRWSYQREHCSLTLASSVEIFSFNWYSLAFDLPAVFVDLGCDLICCDDVYLGSLSVGFGLAEDGFEGIELSYSLSF